MWSALRASVSRSDRDARCGAAYPAPVPEKGGRGRPNTEDPGVKRIVASSGRSLTPRVVTDASPKPTGRSASRGKSMRSLIESSRFTDIAWSHADRSCLCSRTQPHTRAGDLNKTSTPGGRGNEAPVAGNESTCERAGTAIREQPLPVADRSHAWRAEK